MKGIKWRFIAKFVVLCMSLFVVPVFFSNQNTSAQSVSSALAIQRTYRTSYNGSWTTSVRSGGPFTLPTRITEIGNYSYFALRGFNVSGSVPNAQSGISYTGDATINLLASSASDGSGFSCGNVVTFYAKPEQGAIVAQNNSIKSCSVTNNGTSMTIVVHSEGNFSASSNVNSFVVSIYAPESSTGIFSSFLSTSTNFNISLLSLDVDIVVSADPNTALLGGIQNAIDQQNQQDQQDREDMQNASDNASDSGDDSQAQAEATGTTLLKAFTDFVGALTSSTASDCVVNMNMGNLNLGNVDLCTLSIPQPLQAVASIMLIGFCVPLSIATAKKLIGLFRSFQG
ncbi:hypothetical protein IJJ39_01460 [Candidatus Saccharibacteria bacterium]|nr:hypothetical protein [Candidatus Saccharibacteria bacterium]